MPLDLIIQAVDYGQTYVETINDLVLDGEGIESPQAIYDPDVDEEDFQIDPEHHALITCDKFTKDFKQRAVEYLRAVKRKPGKIKPNGGAVTRPHRKFSEMQNRWPSIKQVC